MKPPIKPQLHRPGPPHRHTTQLSPAIAKPAQNRPAGPGYTVGPPVPVAGHSQQIKATLNGTRHVAGSVEISGVGPRKGFIANLKVEHEHRRRGVAAQLIDAAVATARRQGLTSVSLEARPSDNGISPQALVAMYRRQGFRNVGRSHRGSPLMERKL
jgi:ribosomal protein S18 acetylase RimI-like enzyme